MLTGRNKRLVLILGVAILLFAGYIALVRDSVDLKRIFSFVIKKKLDQITSTIFDEKTDYLSLIASAHQTKRTFVYQSNGRRDPMVSLIEKESPNPKIKEPATVTVSPPKLYLNGIMWSENERVAIINGEPVREHDSINEARVLHIGRNNVTLIYQSQKFVLRLK